MYRRAFLQSISSAAVLAAAQQKPAGAVAVKLGFDTYSLRAFNWKAPQLVDYAGRLKLDTIQLSSWTITKAKIRPICKRSRTRPPVTTWSLMAAWAAFALRAIPSKTD